MGSIRLSMLLLLSAPILLAADAVSPADLWWSINLVSDRNFGDVKLYLKFLIPKGSNSGAYLHGLYEVQILDSYGVATLGVHDCGAI